ncbi:class I SAM-dependent RNA methyltransferase [Dongia soli]|uniref:RsmD family RNA methyltransferase n=1 Tax=Dongia soli TaxID=600628 RepID=A0ABU5EDU1_9PROT|nr:RsmD family RNA methyltransferase [Dongia soli]MDY0884220.1 RsmD family RNA methyltransferase [Dongia soli]
MTRHRRPAKGKRPTSPTEPGVTVELTIDSLGQQGDGIALYESRPVFAPFTLPGERVRLRLGAKRGEGRVGNLSDILEPAAERVVAPCRHFGICGGCAIQHLDLAAYRRWKMDAVRHTMAQRGIDMPAVVKSVFIPAGTRRRAVLAVRGQGRGCHIGFHRDFSHDVVDLQQCLLLTPRLFALIGKMRVHLCDALAAGESWDLLATESETGLDLLITAKTEPTNNQRFALADLSQAGGIARISWINGGKKGQAQPEPIAQLHMPQVRFGDVLVDLPHQSFLQPSLEGEIALRDAVMAGFETADHVADLFSGCGTFSFPFAKRAKITAVEGSKPAVQALAAAARRAQLSDRVEAVQRDLDDAPLMPEELKKFDVVVFDPPRAGAKEQAEQLAKSAVPRAIGVSCNPASFARDARLLIDGGFRLTDLTVVDQFIWSSHVEVVGRFER